MYNNNIFVNIDELPRELSASENKALEKRIQAGEMDAINTLIEHNTRLVLHKVFTKFCFVDYDQSELVSVGMYGLVKAANTFDPSKNVRFSTYASRCIENEILLFLRKLRNFRKRHVSIETPIGSQTDDQNIKLIDTIEDDIDWFSECENKATYEFISNILLEIPPRNRKIIMLYFGFVDGKTYSQKEISEIFDLSQSFISRIISKELKNMESKLVEQGLIEHKTKRSTRIYELKKVEQKFN